MAYIKKSVLPSQTGNANKFLKTDGTNTSWAAGGGGTGDLVSTNNLSDVANVATARTNLGLDTTANQSDSSNKRFMSDAQETKLDAVVLPTGTPDGTKYLRDDNTWQTISSALPDLIISKYAPALDQTITAGYSAYYSGYYEIADTKVLEIGEGSTLEIG